MSALVQTSRPTRVVRSHPSRADDGIVVRCDGGSWQVSGPGLGNDLVFALPDDAERLAIGLARRRGTVARIYDATGRLVNAYAG
jgi:hypothetical protein